MVATLKQRFIPNFNTTHTGSVYARTDINMLTNPSGFSTASWILEAGVTVSAAPYANPIDGAMNVLQATFPINRAALTQRFLATTVQHTMSVWARGTLAGGSFFLGYYNGSSPITLNQISSQLTPPPNVWTQYVFSFTPDAADANPTFVIVNDQTDDQATALAGTIAFYGAVLYASTATASFFMAYSSDGTALTTSSNQFTPPNNAWQRFSFPFTTGAADTQPTFIIDNAQTATGTAFAGTIAFSSAMVNPGGLQPFQPTGAPRPTANNITIANPGTGVVIAVPSYNTTEQINSVALASNPTHGTATVSGTNITYTGTTGDSFTYTVTNSGGTSTPGTITVSPPTAFSHRLSSVTGVDYDNLVLFDHFTDFSQWTGPGSPGRWRTSYNWGNQNFSSFRPTEFGEGRGNINGEREWYTDDSFSTASITTGSGTRSCLRIKAQKRDVVDFGGVTHNYSSGIITSQQAQIFHAPVFFEMSCRLPNGIGLWPAFWMYNLFSDTNDEIDFFECSGAATWPDGRTDVSPHLYVTSTLHSPLTTGSIYVKSGARTFNTFGEADPVAIPGLVIPDTTADFFTYACEWRTDEVIVYCNGQKIWEFSTTKATNASQQITHVAQISNPSQGMFLIVNLAINGSSVLQEFVGDAINDTSLNTTPAFMDIDYIGAWIPTGSPSPSPSPSVLPPPTPSAIAGQNYSLVFREEFDTTIDLSPNGAGNHKWYWNLWYQNMTPPAGAANVANSALTLTNFVSGATDVAISTMSQDTNSGWFGRFGYYECRLRYDADNSASWPGFWLFDRLHANGTDGGEWAEIDVMEGFQNGVFVGTNHDWTAGGNTQNGNNWHVLAGNPDLNSYHTYGLLWKDNVLDFYFDDAYLFSSDSLYPIDFQHDMFMILQAWSHGGGSTPCHTDFDWVHIWQ